jgi:L-threonylcarbamoyladenylate synthase
MAVLSVSPGAMAEAILLLRAGETVALPTETVYGLAADGLKGEAVAKIFAAKGRPSFDPLILHVGVDYPLEKIVVEVPERARRLMEVFWPGGLTLVMAKAALVPDLVTSGLPKVAVRCPAHPVMREILREFGGPLAAPSANRFGRITPTDAWAVEDELGTVVPLILDGGRCEIGVESTIVDVTEEPYRLLRPGAIPLEALSQWVEVSVEPGTASGAPVAPGMLASHYAPGTPLFLYDGLLEEGPSLAADVASLTWNRSKGRSSAMARCLSERGDDVEAASVLFRWLRELDQSGARAIYAERVPMDGLGRAIADRLSRASVGSLEVEGERWVERWKK